ncbi:FG-GAP repeat protein [Botrimarina mediterranea]|uniref:FG-GAP repeat protein n=1 Tax=Botrimarina mediterranea TaxID=2528022 RepID=A0A518KDP8_9BACT|nr:FG-GAP repeat protein [Botrimarina mediterranea]QDV75916.1 hypothetical protein Spa11_41390 [Botrimarina mediterranea]QDV80511.1 hypothetical protein K2D_41400 [Planctomycetes bacterium K2D]
MSRTIAVLLAGLRLSFVAGALAAAAVAPAATLTLEFWGNQLTEPVPSPGFNFGAAVDTDGATAIVGTRLGGSDSGIGSGSVYTFNIATGMFGPELVPSDGLAGDRFGDAVAIGRPYSLVGAFNGHDGAGAAYVYNRSGEQVNKLVAADGAAGDRFGDSLDTAGIHALIGAPGDDDFGNASGAAYFFNAMTGVQLHKFAPGDLTASAQFGYATALDESIAAVTSRLDDGTPLGTGSVYFFDWTTGSQLAKSTPSNATAGDRFGESIALDDNVALVGASRGNGGTGAAYLFDATTGDELHVLTPGDGAMGFNFGVSVAIEDGLALVGASSATADGIVTGAVYAYDVATGLEIGRLVLIDREQGDNLGISLAYENGTMIVGSSFDSDFGLRAGAAYLQDIVRVDIPEPSSALLLLTLIAGSAVRNGRHD